MKTLNFDFNVLPAQESFIKSNSRFLCHCGGVGSGKTYGNVYKTIYLSSIHPGIRILVGAQTMPYLRDSTLREFLGICPPEFIKSHDKSKNNIKVVNGSEILFRPFDDPTKLKFTFGAACLEEMTDIKDGIFQMLRTKNRQSGMPGQIYGSTNPGSFSNWVYRDFYETPVLNSEVITSNSFENIHLPGDYLKDLKDLKRTNPDYYKRMVEGIWGQLEGLIYQLRLSQRIDSGDIPRKFERFVMGLDFGFDHPTAIILAGVNGKKYNILKEIYRRKLTSGDIIQILQKILDKIDIDMIYCSPDRPELIEDLKRAGIPATKANNAVFDGIMHVKSLIKQGLLFIPRECHFILREIDSYIWDKRNTVKEIPLAINNDCMDALRYLLYSDSKEIRLKILHGMRGL